MSTRNNIISRAVENLVRSEPFVQLFVTQLLAHLERQLRTEAAGDTVYIPKTGTASDKEARDTEIRSQFTGHNYQELAKCYGLSPRHIRRICK